MSSDFSSLMSFLAQVEKEIIPLNYKQEVNGNTYRQYGEWFIKECFIKKVFPMKNWFSPIRIPGIENYYYPSLNCKQWAAYYTKHASDRSRLNNPDRLGLFLGWPFANKIEASNQADIVYINNGVAQRLRGMYFLEKQQMCIKLGIGEINLSRIANEIKTIQYLNQKIKLTEDVRIPRILNYRIENNLTYFCDEMLTGTVLPFKDKTSLFKVFTFMWNLYQDHEIKFKEIKEILSVDLILKNIAEAFTIVENKMTLEFTRDSFQEKCLTFFTNGRLFPCSLVHGDLKRKNVLIRTNGDICIIDWESSGDKPIIKDFASLYYEYPAYQKSIEKFYYHNLSRRVQATDIATFKEQLLMIHLNRIKPSRSYKYLNKQLNRAYSILIGLKGF